MVQQGGPVVVIGAGILGLVAAYDLTRRGYAVTVLEKGARAGGLAVPRRLANGARIEHFYHHFFAGQRHLLDLLRDLELEERLIWAETSMGFFCDGETYSFDTPLDILTFRPLSPVNRLRFGLGALLLAKTLRGRGEEPAIEWLSATCGRQATRTIWVPLLKMKFGSAYDVVSIGWLKNRICDRQRGRSRGGRERLGYLEGSIGVIIDRLVEGIQAGGSTIQYKCGVERLEFAGGRVRAVHVDRSRIDVEAVVATVPNPVFCRFAAELPAEVLAPLRSIRYQGSICVTVMSKRSLTPHYWTNVVDPSMPFVVAVEHTNFIGPETYGGHLIYLGKYVERDAAEWAMSDSDVIDSFLPKLQRLRPGFRGHDVMDAWVAKDPLTQPVFEKGYRKPAMETGVDNLFLANTSMLFPESRTIDSSIGLAREVNRRVTAFLNGGRPSTRAGRS